MEAPNPASKADGTDKESNSSVKEQYLFLLEFFVHYITGDRILKLNETLRGPTSIELKFLNFQNEAIEITPTHQELSPLARPGIRTHDVEKFYSGRSILFAIPQKVVINKNAEFKIHIRAFKKMPDDIHPDVLIGTGELDISSEFAGLRKEMLQCWNSDIPPAKNYEGPVEIYYNNQLAAVVLAYVRISTFGQSIVTAFDAPADRAGSFVFKGDVRDQEGLAYDCKVITNSLMNIKAANQRSNNKLDREFDQPFYCPPCQDGGKVTEVIDAYKLQDDVIGEDTCENIYKTRGYAGEPRGQPLVLKVSGVIDKDGNVDRNNLLDNNRDHDVFVLRIGKKGLVGEGEKSDIQIEMRTPKALVESSPVRCETREIQTDDVNDEADDNKIITKKIAKAKNKKSKKKIKK
ncbi:uncharacterized protein LOC130672962 [Microplitis mediator]|uniref:uncharacterized protein LOC130672962 n=1 Tax=Microplitis mediator TaxID=375433 RepID=UPI00255791EC|nr:uncharacterized protein LOC130672962 [Microplitis mediator]